METAGPRGDGGALGESLDWLMKNTLDDHGLPFTAESLAYYVQARGVRLSAPYVVSLRTGRRSAPRADLLHTIGDVFGVPMEFFTDPAVRAATVAEGVVPAAERRRQWIDLIHRVAQLSPSQKQQLLLDLEQQDANQ